MIYVLKTDRSLVKIGYAKNPTKRCKAIGANQFYTVGVAFECEIGGAVMDFSVEQNTHKALSEYRVKGEWFSVSPERAIETVIGEIQKLFAIHENTPQFWVGLVSELKEKNPQVREILA